MYKNKGGNGEVARAIKQHFDLVDYMQREGYSFTRKGSELYCNEMHGFCINPALQTFYNHKTERGGSIIDYVMMTDRLTADDAISKLRKEMGGYIQGDATKKYESFRNLDKPKEFVLPKAHEGKYSRLFAYLTKTRSLESSVVADMVKRKMLYEDGKYHNCVFVGYDHEKSPKYASIRSTGEKKVAIDVVGSTKEIGWFVDNDKPSLFVCEAPIDVMSIMSLLKLGGKSYSDYSYLAQGGAGSISTLEYHMKQNPNISKIYLAYDNDEAGQKASVRAREMLKSIGFTGRVIDKIPIGNDFNDDLKAHHSQADRSLKQQEAATQTINKTKLTEEQLCISR